MLIPGRQKKMAGERETGEHFSFSPPLPVEFWHYTGWLAKCVLRGQPGDEVYDYNCKLTNARRYSNSSTQGLADYKTKFETIEPEPVFEESFHGVQNEERPVDGNKVLNVDGATSLGKTLV